MKWFLIGAVGLLCSATWVRGDAAADLYNQGLTALGNNQFDVAAQSFDKIISDYPNSPSVDEVRLRAGFAYLRAGKNPEAVDRMLKEAASNAKPEFRGMALYLTGLAQFSQAQKSTDKTQTATAFRQSASSFTSLINFISQTPRPDNKDYLEQSIYYRALAEYELGTYDSAEKDLQQVIQQFPTSLSRPDYLLRLANLYAVETNQAVTAKRPAETVKAIAAKAQQTFDQVSRDPNALVQANDANMAKAEVLFLIAQLEPPASTAGYEKALAAYRLVRRKDDMIPLQQGRLDALKKAAQLNAQNNTLNSLANDTSLLIDREEGRLQELQSADTPDPIIQALVRMAECYVSMKAPDEARTILHRLAAHAKLTTDQQQEVDFQTLYSYVLGGQTDKADKALTDYLAKHSGDPMADSIGYQIGAKLMERKDYENALKQFDRSLTQFPKGKYAAQVVAQKAEALLRLRRIAEADKVVDDFLRQNPTDPAANQLLLTRAQSKTSRNDFNGALADYQKVRDNRSANPELLSAAAAGYIQTLNSLKRFDDVITESKAFAQKFPVSKALPGVLVYQGMAMDQKHDPAAVATLQDVARKFPKDDASSFALFYVVNIYQRANNLSLMVQAAADLRTAFPAAYALLAQAADTVGSACVKAKKFDDAIAQYQPLAGAPRPEVAADANNKIAGVWLMAAKAMEYQSLPLDQRPEAVKKLTNSEQAYLNVLKNYPDQANAVGDAFQGLTDDLKLHRSWGLLKDADMEAYLAKITADLTSPDMPTRAELAKAALVFLYKGGDKQFPAALDRFRKAIAANPTLRLNRQESNQYGELLTAAKDYTTAQQVFTALLNNADPNDQMTLADGDYGLGASALAQGDLATAKEYFTRMKALNGGAGWHPHINDANYGLALAAEQSGQPAEIDSARQIYAGLMQNSRAGVALEAKAMLGYGRLLEKAGQSLASSPPGSNEFAVHYYQQVPTFFGPAVPELSAEGLYDAGQAYEKAGDKANAKIQYTNLLNTYGPAAPDWASKAQAALAKLGP